MSQNCFQIDNVIALGLEQLVRDHIEKSIRQIVARRPETRGVLKAGFAALQNATLALLRVCFDDKVVVVELFGEIKLLFLNFSFSCFLVAIEFLFFFLFFFCSLDQMRQHDLDTRLFRFSELALIGSIVRFGARLFNCVITHVGQQNAFVVFACNYFFKQKTLGHASHKHLRRITRADAKHGCGTIWQFDKKREIGLFGHFEAFAARFEQAQQKKNC